MAGRRQIQALLELRELRALTQGELAERMGVSQSAVSKLERRPDPSLDALRGYAGALGGTVVVLVRLGERTFEYVGVDSGPPSSR